MESEGSLQRRAGFALGASMVLRDFRKVKREVFQSKVGVDIVFKTDNGFLS